MPFNFLGLQPTSGTDMLEVPLTIIDYTRMITSVPTLPAIVRGTEEPLVSLLTA
jgi:hypothetical protein